MGNSIELLVLVLAALVAVFFGGEPLLARFRERRQQDHVDYLAADGAGDTEGGSRPALERRFLAAGLSGPPEAYLFGLSAFVVVIGYSVLQALPDVPVAALVAGAFAAYLPWMALQEMARRRAARIEQQLTDAIDLAAGTLQAGAGLTQALRSAAASSKQPLRAELEEVTRRVSLSMPLERAFGRLVERYDSEGLRLFTLAIVSKAQAGGELAPVLKSLNETLRDRWRQQRQLRAQLAGARLTSVLVVLLPYVAAPILAYLQPGWFNALLALPIGPALLFFAIMTQLVGALWIWRILSREL